MEIGFFFWPFTPELTRRLAGLAEAHRYDMIGIADTPGNDQGGAAEHRTVSDDGDGPGPEDGRSYGPVSIGSVGSRAHSLSEPS